MYPDRCVLFGRGVPVTVLGGYSREVRQVLERRGAPCVRRRPFHLLNELPHLFGCDDQHDHGFTGDVAPGMLASPDTWA